ncbi:hypothetical protein WA026_022704 [Henosepilachna vigintioctopunctata]|uniref:Peptidase S1 domain-containing protein n=1 Tax=Henosepilachna vigintioctopunctata TaxID=420089 RepID=A0AAW1TZ33_9CUCU
MSTVKSLVLLTTLLILAEGSPVSSTASSPCPEIFRYEQITEGNWKASLTLIMDTDLHGVWIRLFTSPKLVDVVATDNYDVKYNGSYEVRLANRDEFLKANIPKNISLSGKLVDSEIPDLISIKVNGRIICSSDKLNGSGTYKGDFNNKNYLSTVSQNVLNKTVGEVSNCGKALLLNSLVPNDNVKVLPGNWPWQAALFKEVNGSSTLLCEATLISENSLLTSAHCVTWENSRRAVTSSLLGVRLKNINAEQAGKNDVYKVKNVIIHPGFNEKSLTNDIALIKLEGVPEVDDATQPICLPDAGKLPEESFILGYGFRNDGSLTNLAVAKATPMTDEKCIELESSYESLLNDNNFCASYVQDHEVCVGSSGSGFMDTKSDTDLIWELRGVLSVGRALQDKFSCNRDSPVVIVDVSKYLKWIKANWN